MPVSPFRRSSDPTLNRLKADVENLGGATGAGDLLAVETGGQRQFLDASQVPIFAIINAQPDTAKNAYGFVRCDDGQDGTYPAQVGTTEEGDGTALIAWESTGNLNVPIDGSVKVLCTPNRLAAGYTFTWSEVLVDACPGDGKDPFIQVDNFIDGANNLVKQRARAGITRDAKGIFRLCLYDFIFTSIGPWCCESGSEPSGSRNSCPTNAPPYSPWFLNITVATAGTPGTPCYIPGGTCCIPMYGPNIATFMTGGVYSSVGGICGNWGFDCGLDANGDVQYSLGGCVPGGSICGNMFIPASAVTVSPWAVEYSGTFTFTCAGPTGTSGSQITTSCTVSTSASCADATSCACLTTGTGGSGPGSGGGSGGGMCPSSGSVQIAVVGECFTETVTATWSSEIGAFVWSAGELGNSIIYTCETSTTGTVTMYLPGPPNVLLAASVTGTVVPMDMTGSATMVGGTCAGVYTVTVT
jgi:hypothetical protein